MAAFRKQQADQFAMMKELGMDVNAGGDEYDDPELQALNKMLMGGDEEMDDDALLA